MQIIEHVRFDSSEWEDIRRAFRWVPISLEQGLSEDEKKGLMRLRDNSMQTRPQLCQCYHIWTGIVDTMRRRIAELQDLKSGKVKIAQPVNPGAIPLIADPVQFAIDNIENLNCGMQEVLRVCSILWVGICSTRNPQDEPTNASDDIANANHAQEYTTDGLIVVRR